jgi:DNA replication and repair protein RecF
MLSPFDMNLLYFAPVVRRDYIDSILARTFAQFSKVRRDYETVMRQRNSLLKKIRDGEANREDLDFWDRTFALKAYLYLAYRQKFVDFVEMTRDPLRAFLPRYDIEFLYDTKIPKGEDIELYISQYLRENRDRDILTGHTHIGPHLDDFSFSLHGGTDATMMLSRGETKMLLLALKQIEILFLRKHLSLPIVLLFDDLFAELDLTHALRVIDIFDADQVLVTSQRPLPK